MTSFDKDFWRARYQINDIGWDLGAISPPIKTYVDSLMDTSIKILIPGGGNCYEIEYLNEKRFLNTFLVDISPEPIENIRSRNPLIDPSKLICGDFFEHEGQYDLIIEQTFFCALNPILRLNYVKQMYALLKPEGKIAGVLFNAPLNDDKPPFGGDREEYIQLFSDSFNIEKMEPCYNSFPSRAGREFFIEFNVKVKDAN